MRKLIYSAAIFALILSLGSCVESSSKYKMMSAKVDSLTTVTGSLNTEMETVLSEINEVSQGLQSIREAEQILSVATQKESQSKSTATQQIVQIKADIQSLVNTIEDYKAKLAKLESKSSIRSSQLNKMIAGLKEELKVSQQEITQYKELLAQKEKELQQKGIVIAQLTDTITNLNNLTSTQKEQLQKQDQALHQINYLMGTTKELKERGVISRRGLFAPPVITTQAIQAGFNSADMREFTKMEIKAKKAKVLSVHDSDSYTLSTPVNDIITLEITNPEEFWKNTKYLVVQTN